MSAPLIIAEPRGGTASAPWSALCIEAVEHMRLSHIRVDPAEAIAVLHDAAILLLPAPATFGEDERVALENWVRRGGTLIACGGAHGLGAVAGVQDDGAVGEGHVRIDPVWNWAPRIDAELHAFGGQRLALTDDEVAVWGRWADGAPAITRRVLGDGEIVIIGADVWQSVGRIQQGWPVERPGAAAPDGSAAVGADGILRADDGLALSFDLDRRLPGGQPATGDHASTYPPEKPVPIFDRPQADLWRELVQHLLFDGAERTATAIGWLNYWPAGVSAIGHISHDSDLNIDEEAIAGLEAFASAGVAVTWCHCWPGGYAEETVAAIAAAGHEQALHFNALADSDGMPWSLESLREQHQWAKRITGEPIISNKNHYTRWEGWTQFYEWCAQVGIQIDETRGPSKAGTVGFPYGTSHVGFPVSEAGAPHTVLALPLHCQDLGWASHEAAAPTILDQALARNGVAHFLFHCVHLSRRPRVVDALREVVSGGRRRGMPWWTAAQINAFERSRRRIEIDVRANGAGWVVRADATGPLGRAGILVAVSDVAAGWKAHRVIDGVDVPVAVVERHGRAFVELLVDLPTGATEIALVPATGG